MGTLNTTYYNGRDHYAVDPLTIEIEAMICEKKIPTQENMRLELLPHLSNLRENILNWYPFTKNDVVLEIESGFGGITGLLCRKAGKVVSVEQSLKRANINSTRHNKCENLDICVGQINEIELKDKFDYIVLNGTFHNIAAYTHTANPHHDFLLRLKELLSEKGKILIATENRLGLKYFAGDQEEHTGIMFDGLQLF